MIKHKLINTAVSGVFFVTMVLGLAGIAESNPPFNDSSFNIGRETRIQTLRSLPIEQALNGIKSGEAIGDVEFLDQAVGEVFGHRKIQVVNHVMDNIKLPLFERSGDEEIRRYDEFLVSKAVLQTFSAEALGPLLNLYHDGDPTAKGNAIRVFGGMGDRRIDALLVDALGDISFREQEDPEAVGEPLRVCDEAYNQIVLYFKIRDVPRTIGNATSIEDRDDYIEALKNLL